MDHPGVVEGRKTFLLKMADGHVIDILRETRVVVFHLRLEGAMQGMHHGDREEGREGHSHEAGVVVYQVEVPPHDVLEGPPGVIAVVDGFPM